MGPGPVRAADEKATSVGQKFSYIVPWVFFSVKKSDDESNFDGLSVRMQNTAKKTFKKHGRITEKMLQA